MKKRKKIALFSPLNPIKTGISDYTEEIVAEMKKFFDIDIVIDLGYEPQNKEIRGLFKIFPYDPKRFDSSEYDEILYHMGNNYQAHGYIYDSLKRFPGIVVLHDFVLQGFYAEKYDKDKDFDAYLQVQKKYYGDKGVQIAENLIHPKDFPIWEQAEAFDYPLNEEILEAAKAVIVHSDFVRDKVKERTHKPVVKINHHGHVLKGFDRPSARTKFGLSQQDIVIISTGFINKNKRLGVILSALEELNFSGLTYVIAGQDKGRLLRNYLGQKKLNVVIKDYLPLEELEALIFASDICINLRYPTMGESSGSLLRMMGYGKPVLVTNFGSYSEFPDYCVLKIDPDIDEKEAIKRFVAALIKDEDFRISLGEEASLYVQNECNLQRCASDYASFIFSKESFTQ
jgi:glycosyltransferase involved in cell wall biosynthesis